MLQAGQAAPAFSLSDGEGQTISLDGLKGKQVVLFFYPKDDTPGCTIEACAFRDDKAAFDGLNTVILGISRDGAASHQAFAGKFSLNFPLLIDEGGRTAEAYGVIQEGRFIRSTFLIGEDGVIKHIWQPVDVNGHSLAVRQVIEGG